MPPSLKPFSRPFRGALATFRNRVVNTTNRLLPGGNIWFIQVGGCSPVERRTASFAKQQVV